MKQRKVFLCIVSIVADRLERPPSLYFMINKFSRDLLPSDSLPRGMADTNSFYNQFRWTLIVTYLTGTYIPEMSKILPKNLPALLAYAFPLLLTYMSIDFFLVLTIDSDELDSFMYIYLMGAVPLCTGSLALIIYCKHHRDDMRDFILMWDCDFQPELWPELREVALKQQKQKAWRQISIMLKYYVFPNLILVAMFVLKGDYILPSIFVPGKDEMSERFVLLMQGLTSWSHSFWYSMLQSFFSTFMRLILVELEYFELSLKKLFSTIQLRGDGSITRAGKIMIGVQLTAQEHIEMCHETEQKLFKLISYHTKILKFSRKVEKFFGPVFLGQVTVPSMMMSQIVYGVITGMLNTESAVLILSALVYLTFLTYLSCAIGEEVNKKSSRCMDSAFYGNWSAYSLRIKKLLIPMIVVANQRPITVNPLGSLPMLRETFLSLVSFQYKFFRFISDTYSY